MNISDSTSCASMVPVKEDMQSSDSKFYSFVTPIIQGELDCLHEETKQKEKDLLVPQEGSFNETASLTEDDDDLSHGSFSILLSETSSISDSSFECTSTNLERMEKEFARRDKLLQKLLKGIDPAYARAMRENEQAVRKLKLQQLQRSETPNQSSQPLNAKPKPDELAIKTIGSFERMRRALAFEIHNTLPGAIIVFLNCIAHGCCYQTIIQVIDAITADYDNQVWVAVVVILFSIVLLRFSGGLWEYVSSETYERVKFDMHNRLRLGKLDALIMQWFHKRPNMYTFANAFAFFASYDSVVWLQERCLAAFDQREIIFQSLPSVKQGVMTTLNEMIANGHELQTVPPQLVNATCVAGFCGVEELRAHLYRQDDAYLQSVLSKESYENFFGWKATVFIGEGPMTGYWLASMFLSIFLLRTMGHKFWEHEN
jgi:hypothetical protein